VPIFSNGVTLLCGNARRHTVQQARNVRQNFVSSARGTSNPLPSTGWRKRDVSSMRSGRTNLSHAVTSASTLKVTVFKYSIPATISLCIVSFLY
jgi:hypothetical protein